MAPRFNVVARLVGELTAGLLDTAADHARIVLAREEVLHAITTGKSLINVEDGRQAAYWQQGDERLSTAEAFHALQEKANFNVGIAIVGVFHL